MSLIEIDTGGIARSLSQVADHSDDQVDLYLEVLGETTVGGRDESLAAQIRSERGLAVRLLRHGQTWLASTDEISAAAFSESVALVARARPGAVAPPPRSIEVAPPPSGDVGELEDFASRVAAAIRRRHAAFPVDWQLTAHLRATRVVGTMLAPPPQEERFYSCRVQTPAASWGSLFLSLDATAVESVADSLTSLFRVRKAPDPPLGATVLALGPSATAVLLHEAVAHVLETDTLALTGKPESAVGVRLGSRLLDVVDDPGHAAEAVRRTVDDEGMPVVRRFLLREGAVVEPLADLAASAHGPDLMPGAGRRGSRHLPPVPRSTHLELLPPLDPAADILEACGNGLYLRQFSRGRLDPITGDLELKFPFAREVANGSLGKLIGPGRIRASVAGLLHKIAAIGGDMEPAGAGWCAKGGHRVPVWALVPSIVIADVEVGA